VSGPDKPEPIDVESQVNARPFPPPRDFSSLSVKDLLEAREQYHVHLSNMETVVGTAIGRFRIHKDSWIAKYPPSADVPKQERVSPDGPRTFENTVLRPWSWPCVLVMVDEWVPRGGKGHHIPKQLFLQDGRVIPVCVILAPPDEALPPPTASPQFASDLLGGGYACVRRAQGMTRTGTIGCMVERQGTYYALTNRHVTGPTGEDVHTLVRGERVVIGRSDRQSVNRTKMSEIFPEWPGDRTYVNVDAGLVELRDVNAWTSQVFGIGEIGEPFDANPSTLTLDMIGCPLRGFGGTSGVLEGEIQALFVRYKSLGGFDYVSDLLIGRRAPDERGDRREPNPPSNDTHPGDSGTLWFYDPPNAPKGDTNQILPEPPPDRGARARRLRPIAMQWGGQRVRYKDGRAEVTAAHALATFVSTVCRILDVDIVRGYSTGHDEYWGKIGHFSIGWNACDAIAGVGGSDKLADLMQANQANIGFPRERIVEGGSFRKGRGGFVPLADVPDYVWGQRANESIQHFADIDIVDIDGGETMLTRCAKDPKNLSAKAWKAYFDGFKAQGVGPDEGALPFRVWQLWNAMVEALSEDEPDVLGFVTAAGVMAHYLGDASQPLHCSYLHHGHAPTKTHAGRKYPVRHASDEYAEYHDTPEAKIHAIYEEGMLEIDPDTALGAALDALADPQKLVDAVKLPDIDSGWAAAQAVIGVMSFAREHLTPDDIIKADDPDLTQKERAARLWKKEKVRKATPLLLATSAAVLAQLWAGAWKAGKGDRIAKAELGAFTEKQIQKSYNSHDLAALGLDEMAESGTFEPAP
jgi:hypothetical protein